MLVEYGYDRPIVSISGNATAQNAIQADLDATIQTQHGTLRQGEIVFPCP